LNSVKIIISQLDLEIRYKLSQINLISNMILPLEGNYCDISIISFWLGRRRSCLKRSSIKNNFRIWLIWQRVKRLDLIHSYLIILRKRYSKKSLMINLWIEIIRLVLKFLKRKIIEPILSKNGRHTWIKWKHKKRSRKDSRSMSWLKLNSMEECYPKTNKSKD
jgi:hypothetical protein